MGRALRAASGDIVYHVHNRANARVTLFEDEGDYAAFERVVAQACTRVSMRLLAYCVMPNHWHLVVWPRHDGDLSRFMNWLTLTHTQRWHQHRHSVGEGHVYQGRFKSFPVETNAYSPSQANPPDALSASRSTGPHLRAAYNARHYSTASVRLVQLVPRAPDCAPHIDRP